MSGVVIEYSVEITESYIRIPVHNKSKKDKTIRTITISDNQGIKALYSVERKVILTLLFNKKERYGWTVKKAKEWKREHMSSIEDSLRHAGFEIEIIKKDLVDDSVIPEDYELIETHVNIKDESDEDDEGTHHLPKKKKKKKKKKKETYDEDRR